jgi:hypothetical protein
LKNRTKKDIVEKALSNSGNKVEICRNGVWLPVPADVYQKMIDLLRATGNGRKPLRGDWRLGIIPQKHQNGKDYAIVITSDDVQEIIREEDGNNDSS